MKKRFKQYLDKVRDDMHLKVGEITVGYTIAPEKVSDLPKISDSRKVYNYILPSWENIQSHESFKAIYLSRSNRIIGHITISKGTSIGTLADPKDIIAPALNIITCSGIIVIHNHPSGNLKPSESDEQLIKRIKEGCKLMDLTLLDSLIISSENYLSFADEGLL